MTAVAWSAKERRAWHWPAHLKPSEWAERHRILPPSLSAEPGPWRNSRTPYLVGIMDAICEPGVEQVVFLKPVQVGYSEAIRNLLGYFIDHDPGPSMLVMPDEKSANEAVEERIRPLIAETPAVRRHQLDSRSANKVSAIRFDTMSLYTGWAGSPQALATRPVRYLLLDEIDKYPPFAGREADPIALAMKRLTTFGHRARAIMGSTPTTRTGPIWKAWEDCTDRRHFMVPCPKCSHLQRMIWSQVRWPKALDSQDRNAHAESIEAQASARYECESCKAQWSEADKNAAVRLGEWRSETPNASVRRVGFHLSSVYSPWVSMSKLAGEFIRGHGDPRLMMDFANSRLAEPFEEQASVVKQDVIRDKAKHGGEPGRVPAWARLLVMTADVQKAHAYWVVRAWGYGFRSQLVANGLVGALSELPQIAFERGFIAASGEVVPCALLAIDSRYRADEVLAMAATDPGRILPTVGTNNIAAMPVVEQAVRGYPGVIRRTVNPNHWKDVLWGLITDADPTRWTVHSQATDDYCRQMSSEHKVLVPKTGRFAWMEKSQGAPNHYWDCEALQCVVAQLAGVGTLPEESPQEATPRPQAGIKNPLSYGKRW